MPQPRLFVTKSFRHIAWHCSKSKTSRSNSAPALAPPARYVGGEILLEGRDVLKMSSRELRDIRGGLVSYVFQEPGA